MLGRNYIALSPWHFGDFCNIFLPIIGEDQKKSCDLSAGPLIGTAQTRRHAGADRGRAPQLAACASPNENCPPPKRGLCPEEINRLGASGAQIEAQISVFLWTDTGFCDVFGMKTFFLFLEITCFRPEKPLEIPIAAGKSLEIFAPHLVHLIQSGINFSCPVPLSNSHKINFS